MKLSEELYSYAPLGVTDAGRDAWVHLGDRAAFLEAEVNRLQSQVTEWGMKNEIAAPPLDWKGLGDILGNSHD